jgi:hypothetical protein
MRLEQLPPRFLQMLDAVAHVNFFLHHYGINSTQGLPLNGAQLASLLITSM